MLVRCNIGPDEEGNLLTETNAESNAAGLSLRDCGDNVFCCNGGSDSSCCDTQGEHFFVDPKNGDVKDPSKASATTSGTWWTVNSTSLLASTSAPTSTPSSSPAETTASTTNTPTNSAEAEKDAKLSTGAAAGIGIGAAVGLAAAVAGVWFLLRRRKKNVAVAHEPLGDGHAQEYNYAGGYAPTAKHDHDVYQDAPTPLSTYTGPSGIAPHATGPQELAGETRHELN
ncbi:hypothetical protein N0V90_007316 [Kalmusia sp. IMI 367209]|nr:hypothetical protein N0V90_007316 [Kalmusia sp. IMI 367209]